MSVAPFIGCSSNLPRPSVLLFVIDTLRADAVSAYGPAAGTTPEIDKLAAHGLRYTRAYANASWTLPSHVTLFTGLLPSEHGVGWQRTIAADSLEMLAERLRAAGYDTMGVSENPWVSETFNLAQGFDSFVDTRNGPPDVVETVTGWLRNRRSERPFFVFVNVIDPHWPYEIRAQNPFLPPGVTTEQAAAASQWPPDWFCADRATAADWAVQYGLYLGDVAAADAKLGRLAASLHEAGFTSNLITIVTSDHGEHFGEHRLASHQFSVREALLHVPLVVHGVPNVVPSVIDDPVQLADLTPTILGWVGLPIPSNLSGRPIPTRQGNGAAPRDIIADFLDPAEWLDPADPLQARLGRGQVAALRSHCRPDDRVWGDMRALIRFPLKLIWFKRFPAELYNLNQDPSEDHDVAAQFPQVTAHLVAELDARFTTASGASHVAQATATLPPAVVEQLKALGYTH